MLGKNSSCKIKSTQWYNFSKLAFNIVYLYTNMF